MWRNSYAGGINKYGLSCAGLTENLLKDNRWSYGMRDEAYDEEGNVIAEGDEATAIKQKGGRDRITPPLWGGSLFSLIFLFSLIDSD